MIYEIVWSEQASSQVQEIKDYITDQWSDFTAFKFEELLDYKISIIRAQPHTGSLSKKRLNIYYYVIRSQLKIFYRIEKESITILGFFDTRQDPNKAPF